MAALLSAIREKAHFFSNALATFDQSAALLPSSRTLVRAMLEPLPLQDAKVVVEFGPGTGVMTRGLLDRMRPDARLYSIELDPKLHATLERTVQDPRLKAVHGDAAQVEEILRAHGHSTCDVLLSSLGLSMIPAAPRQAIWDGAMKVLRPDSVVTQYAYKHAKFIVFSPTSGFSRFDARPFLAGYFEQLETREVWPNFPPATVFTCRGPKCGGALAREPKLAAG